MQTTKRLDQRLTICRKCIRTSMIIHSDAEIPEDPCHVFEKLALVVWPSCKIRSSSRKRPKTGYQTKVKDGKCLSFMKSKTFR